MTNNPGNPPPGWNDPPIFSYEATSSPHPTSSKKGCLLTKRVAFPLNSTPDANSPSKQVSTMPPSTPPRPPPTTEPEEATSSERVDSKNDSISTISKKETLSRTLGNLEDIVKDYKASAKPKHVDEIQKRLTIMQHMWEDDKLVDDVCSKMVQLSEDLKKGRAEEADNIHKGLMVDHISQCSTWMVGIRHLIHHVRSARQNDEGNEVEN